MLTDQSQYSFQFIDSKHNRREKERERERKKKQNSNQSIIHTKR